MINTIVQWLKGKKTYFLALLAIVYVVSAYFTGHMDSKTALEMLWAALTSATMRAGIAKVQ